MNNLTNNNLHVIFGVAAASLSALAVTLGIFGAKKAAPVVAKGVNKVKGLFKRNKDNTDETTEE